MIRDILLLGNPKLYEKSAPVTPEEIDYIKSVVADMHDTLMEYRRVHKAGRAIAAPQIGVQKRLLYMCIDQPVAFINPVLTFPDDEMMEVLDDCMSFPGLLVRLHRYKRCVIEYYDFGFNMHSVSLEGDLSELLQHEYDHLDGVLATMRADDNRSLLFAETVSVK